MPRIFWWKRTKRKKKRLSVQQPTVCYTGFIPEIGQWGSNGPPSVILGGHISRKGGPRKGVLQKVFDSLDALVPFWNILISGQLKKPGLELLQNPGCLSGEIMTQMKKRKAIESVAIKVQSKFIERPSNQCCCQ